MIALDNISVDFGSTLLFKDISFIINKKDKIGLVGKNGAGKSTLFKLIIQELNPTSGNISIPNGIHIGYLPQFMEVDNTHTLKEEVKKAFFEIEQLHSNIQHLSNELVNRTDYESSDYLALADKLSDLSEQLNMLGADTMDADIERCLLGLGFEKEDMERPTSELSGGWRMRVEIAKLLLKKPEVLLLDEPTNHLDIESIQWLEEFLSNYYGAVLIISHDRAFLDNVTKRTIELVKGRSYDYPMHYSKFVEARKERIKMQQAAYANQQREIEKSEEFIEKFRYKATKAVQVQQKIRQLEKTDRIEIDEEETSEIKLRFPPAPRSVKTVAKLEHLTKKYDDHLVLKDIDLTIDRGDRLAFVGRNGEGKTTLIKVIMNETDFTGHYEIGDNVSIGYYAQNQDELLDKSKTVFETIDDIAVGDIRHKIRTILGSFLFSGEDIDKKVSVLSGGECSRLALATLLLRPYNLLILDEPTNHLDMRSKDILKQALLKYDGTLILVSHDRDFLSGLTNKIYEFKNHRIRETIGDVNDFLRKKKIEHLNELEKKQVQEKKRIGRQDKATNKQAYEQRKKKNNECRKLEKEIRECEAKIEQLETEMEEMNHLLSDPKQICMDDNIFDRYKQKEDELAIKMSRWEQLNVQYEKMMEAG
jgi:ATP-binding cassette subfamily F protein 3